jgi:hypothetical protein
MKRCQRCSSYSRRVLYSNQVKKKEHVLIFAAREVRRPVVPGGNIPAHTREDIDQTVAALSDSIDAMIAEDSLGAAYPG